MIVLLSVALPACGGGDSGSGPTPAPTPTPTPSAQACAAGPPVPGTPNLISKLVARGLESPLDVQAPPSDPRRIFIVEQRGRIRVVRNGELLPTPFLDISDRVKFLLEQGLLGLAFHPRFSENGRFFVNYVDRMNNTHVVEFHAAPTADTADASSERLVLFVQQPFATHKGGGLAFGRDGFLYISLGDGGSGADPLGNGQNLGTMLGKLLRIDVDRGSPYAVPPDNPFASRAGARPEIWAYGLRNPFRFSIDRTTGDLYIGDVGEGRREEIDVSIASRGGGENYGWSIMEGSLCFNPPSGCDKTGLTLPTLEYGEGCAVIGGPVYHGCRMPGYHGTYFYGDHCEAFVRSFRFANGAATQQRDWTRALATGVDLLSSFGVDSDGEMYLVDYEGEVFKVVPAD